MTSTFIAGPPLATVLQTTLYYKVHEGRRQRDRWKSTDAAAETRDPTERGGDEVSTVAPFAGLPDQTEHRLHRGAPLVPSIDDIDPPRQVEASDWQNHCAGWRSRPLRTEAKAPPSSLCDQRPDGGEAIVRRINARCEADRIERPQDQVIQPRVKRALRE